MIESNHVVLWNRCLDVIKDNVPETTYNTWFAPIVPLKYEDKTLILQIPSQFFYEILECYKIWNKDGGECSQLFG